MTIYARPDSREKLLAWYPRFLAKIDVPTEERTVSTRFGDTHVLIAGPAGAPPLVVFHGVMATSAHVLREVRPLVDKYRVYAVDVLGHSPLSADNRPALEGYGDWATDVLDQLGLDVVSVIGVSYGGFVTIRLLTTSPKRVSRASLVVPGGLVNGPAMAGFLKLFWPMTMYRWFPSEARLRTLTDALFTEWDDDWGHWLGDALLNFKMDLRVPPVATRESLAGFTGPVQIFGASDDLSFPGGPAIARAKEVFAQVADTHVYTGMKHSPPFNDTFRADLCSRIERFLSSRAAA